MKIRNRRAESLASRARPRGCDNCRFVSIERRSTASWGLDQSASRFRRPRPIRAEHSHGASRPTSEPREPVERPAGRQRVAEQPRPCGGQPTLRAAAVPWLALAAVALAAAWPARPAWQPLANSARRDGFPRPMSLFWRDPGGAWPGRGLIEKGFVPAEPAEPAALARSGGACAQTETKLTTTSLPDRAR